MRAQGTVEYLVVVAVVVVLSLVVVGLLVSQTGSFDNISATTSKISQSSGVISISEAVIDSAGEGLISLSNNTGGVLRVTKLSVEGFDTNYSGVYLLQGDEKTLSLGNIGSGCSCVGFEGETRTCDVVVYAESEYGLQKQFPTSVSVNCVLDAKATASTTIIQPVSYAITLTLKDSFRESNLTGFSVDCNGTNNDFTNQTSPATINFSEGAHTCTISKSPYDSNTISIVSDSAKSLTFYLDPPHTNLSGCTTLSTTDGNYILTSSFGSGGACLVVTANNVFIKGNRYTITGNVDASNATGVAYTNLTLKNSIVTGSVLANGGNNTSGTAYAAGKITLLGTSAGNIYTWGGASVGVYNAGRGGDVSLTDSNVTGSIDTTGGWSGHATGNGTAMTYGGAGGDVNLTNSNVTSDINARGSAHYLSGYSESRGQRTGGTGGYVRLVNSTVRDILSYGTSAGNGSGSPGQDSNGGAVELTNSRARNITNYGGESGDNKSGGAGGNVTLTDSNLTGNITSYGGGGGYCYGYTLNGNGSRGGDITLTRSIALALSNYGGYGGGYTFCANAPGGVSATAGNITLTNSSVTTITSYGGAGNYGRGTGASSAGSSGGTLTLTDSNVTTVSLVGGAGGTGGSANAAGGNGGTATLTNAILITSITTAGGNSSVAGGNGGNVTFNVCPTIIPAVTVTGGTGTPAGTAGTITPSSCHNP